MSTIVTVTGASGYIASHVVRLLLEKGYRVKATVRDAQDPAKVDHLKSLPRADGNLELFSATLLDTAAWREAVRGAECVFHIASPLTKAADGRKEILEPAVQGTLNLLGAVAEEGVAKTVVMTSSMSAVAPKPEPSVKNESHWSDSDMQIASGNWYGASKTLAEKAAIDFVASLPEEKRFKLVRICPTMVVGPMLQPGINMTMGYFLNILKSQAMSKVPNDSMSLIDVRDCAAHHVAAYELGKEGRYMSVVESLHWTDLLQLFKNAHPTMKMPQLLEPGCVLARPTQFDLTRMRTLGVQERSIAAIIEEAIAHFKDQGHL